MSLPPEQPGERPYGLILAADRILDMCRTSVNVWSDMVGAAVLARWEGYPLRPSD